MVRLTSYSTYPKLTGYTFAVRLGNSGLKVSRVILGTMQYGHPEYQGWQLPEDQAIEHIKFACVHGPFLVHCQSGSQPVIDSQLRGWYSDL